MHTNPLFIPTIIGAVALFWGGVTLERRLQPNGAPVWLWIAGIVAAVPGILFVLYYVHIFDNAAWFYNLRALPYIELAVSGLGLTAGAVHAWWQPESLGEKLAVPVILLVLVLTPFVKPLLDPLDQRQLKERYDGAVCLQSTFSTCGPASAVTLLRFFGENATEREFARECFTSRGGTEVWYIARALRRRGFDSHAVVQDAQAINNFPSPAIAGVVLRGGAGHFIAVLGAENNFVTLADPLKGKLVVRRSELLNQYHFTGFFLVLHPPKN